MDKLAGLHHLLDGFREHYVIIGLGLLASVAAGSWIGGVVSKTHAVSVGFIGALGFPVQQIYLLAVHGGEGFNYELAPLAFGWRPNPLRYLCLLVVLTPLFGFLGGCAARSSLGDTGIDQSPLCRVLSAHWMWLWLPLSSWAFVFPSVAYSVWLLVAGTWHWTVHPSLWFNWRWLVSLSFGAVFTYLPYALLSTGVTEACTALGDGSKNGLGKFQVALRFVAWGFGAAVFGSSVTSLISFWILSKLPVIAAQKPWWAFF